ncbi:MAG: photosynthetic reaction center cytochrome PufC [Pseudomonadota bacterium]
MAFNLPPWYSQWKKDNPVSYRGPVILLVVGFTVFLSFIALMVYWSYLDPRSIQTGPRGTGMTVEKFAYERNAPIPGVADYYTEEAYAPEGDETLASEAYENVQVLGDLTEDNFNRLMLAMTEWVSPEQGCVYCHNEENLASDDVYTKIVARRMIQMTQNINENWDGHVGDVGVNCYSCHQGQNVPSNIWFKIAPGLEAAEGWGARQNLATTQTVSTSLPHDALEELLIEEAMIKVHDLEPRVPGIPGQGDLASIQDTERTYSLMNYFANSLGVNCTFCHNSRAFYDGAEVTPQWATAFIGIDMVREMNSEYLVPLQETYPPHRLGPKFGDAPKAACKTCHKGVQKPLGGLGMIADWPELVGSGAPTYE